MYLNISFDQELHFVLFYFKKIIFSCSVKKNQKMFFATETWSETSSCFSAARAHVRTPH